MTNYPDNMAQCNHEGNSPLVEADEEVELEAWVNVYVCEQHKGYKPLKQFHATYMQELSRYERCDIHTCDEQATSFYIIDVDMAKEEE